MRNYFIIICLSFVYSQLAGQVIYNAGIEYFTESTIHKEPVKKKRVYGEGTKSDSTFAELFQLIASDGSPISYFQNIDQEICFDGTCRKLNVDVFWNVTGRYLGFRLPHEEFLSKAEHKPFTADEYIRLHEILMDSISILGSMDINEIVSKKSVQFEVDGITRPTSTDILQSVVKGAVFTTYTMWNAVYGKMQLEVEKTSENALNDAFLLEILNSKVLWDQIWGLRKLSMVKAPSKPLKEKVEALILKKVYSTSMNAISSIPSEWLADTTFQRTIWDCFYKIDYALKPKLIEKLTTSNHVQRSILFELASNLSQQNGELLKASLASLKNYVFVYPEIYSKIENLAGSSNPYISKLADQTLKDAKLK